MQDALCAAERIEETQNLKNAIGKGVEYRTPDEQALASVPEVVRRLKTPGNPGVAFSLALELALSEKVRDPASMPEGTEAEKQAKKRAQEDANEATQKAYDTYRVGIHFAQQIPTAPGLVSPQATFVQQARDALDRLNTHREELERFGSIRPEFFTQEQPG
jgi:hypothetical protein